MRFPRWVYAIYPLDENGNITGVYVGSSATPHDRVKRHCYSIHDDKQFELHSLMRTNGYYYCLLEKITEWDQRVNEYLWIKHYMEKGMKVYNILTDCHEGKKILYERIPGL